MKSARRAVVLGGTGFLGHAVSQALRQVEAEVICVDRQPGSLEGIQNVVADIYDAEVLTNLLQEGDDVFHFAYSGVPATVQEDNDSLSMYEMRQLCGVLRQKKCGSFFLLPAARYMVRQPKPLSEKIMPLGRFLPTVV